MAVIRFPHIANFTDVAPLAAEPDVAVQYVEEPAQLAGAAGRLAPTCTGCSTTTCSGGAS